MTQFKPITASWKETSNDIWLFSRLSLKRNIKKYKFPAKMSAEEKSNLRDVIKATLVKHRLFKSGKYFPANTLSPSHKDYLYEHFLSSHPLQHMQASEGLLYDDKGRFLCIFNNIDHVRINLLNDSNDLFDSWKLLVDCESYLEKSLGFSFSSRFGFLTANSNECGIGMEARVFLHAPALVYSKKIEEHSKDFDFLQVESLEGGASHFVGDLVLIKNYFSLGCKEEVLLSQMQELALKLVVEEKALRHQLKEKGDQKLFDLVGRSFGVLKYSHQLDLQEALDALGKMRIGIDLGWVKNLSHKQINRLLFSAGRGHLMLSQGAERVHPEDVNQKRAEFFRKSFKRVSLKD